MIPLVITAMYILGMIVTVPLAYALMRWNSQVAYPSIADQPDTKSTDMLGACAFGALWPGFVFFGWWMIILVTHVSRR